jgi:hypothetical protein
MSALHWIEMVGGILDALTIFRLSLLITNQDQRPPPNLHWLLSFMVSPLSIRISPPSQFGFLSFSAENGLAASRTHGDRMIEKYLHFKNVTVLT